MRGVDVQMAAHLEIANLLLFLSLLSLNYRTCGKLPGANETQMQNLTETRDNSHREPRVGGTVFEYFLAVHRLTQSVTD